MKTVGDRILAEISRQKKGWCFSQKDFLGIAGRDAIDQSLSRLVRAGSVRRFGWGLYDVPSYSETLKTTLSPDIDQVARAMARKNGWRIQPSGAIAANMLGLSTQVPAKVVYLSDGPSKTLKIGNSIIYFKQTAPKNMTGDESSDLVIQALKYMGRENVDDAMIDKIRRQLPEKHKRQLLKDARFRTDWIFEAVQRICRKGDKDG